MNLESQKDDTAIKPMDRKLKEFYENLRQQEKRYGIKICVPETNIIDAAHLDCFWYGGEVGYIEYKGYKIVIGAYGDKLLEGTIKGVPFYYKNRDNRYSIHDGDTDLIVDDSHLYELLESEDTDNSLRFINNNWFEVDIIDPSGRWIDLCGCDNVLENNLLDCFSDVETYFEYVHWAIENKM